MNIFGSDWDDQDESMDVNSEKTSQESGSRQRKSKGGRASKGNKRQGMERGTRNYGRSSRNR